MKAVLLGSFIGLSMCSLAFWLESRTTMYRYRCWMVSDGAVYCYADDGHIFRPRVPEFERFTIEVER